ncbi:MAG: hypothetical protein ACRC6B_12620 [Fusobacteriaceae bacterium]
MDYLVQETSGLGIYLSNINNNLLGNIFTQNVLLVISWLSYFLLIFYVFKAFKTLKIEGFKMVTLVIYNLFLQIEKKTMEKSYYFWIISIVFIFVIENIAVKYAPENIDVIDTTPEEEKEI